MPTDVSEAKGTKRLFAELDPIWSGDQRTVHPVRWEGVSRFGPGGGNLPIYLPLNREGFGGN